MAAVVGLVYGCSAVGPESPGQQVSKSSQTNPRTPGGWSPSEPASSCPAPAPSTITASQGSLPEGVSFGFIHHFDGADLYVDPAEYFTGKDAVRAAHEDGKLGPGEDLPDPFYIRNKDTTLLRESVAGTFTATVLDNQLAKRHLTASEFAELYCGGSHDSWLYADPSSLPMRLRVSDGLLAKGDEQYLP